MIVVIAKQHDAGAGALAQRWAGANACLLTVEDMSLAGWRYWIQEPRDGVVVANGRRVAVKKIRGVLVRLPRVTEGDLPHIAPADRTYVAAEMTAMLAAWLSQLSCPVLNRPTPVCLLGPAWTPEHWTFTAARLGIPVQPVRRHCALDADAALISPNLHSVTVTVVAHRCFGASDQTMADHARVLAQAANVDLLSVEFSQPPTALRFERASIWPALAKDDVIDAVLDFLMSNVDVPPERKQNEFDVPGRRRSSLSKLPATEKILIEKHAK